jgi:redox-sensitive bicupin YhaK (pirin superfamily)
MQRRTFLSRAAATVGLAGLGLADQAPHSTSKTMRITVRKSLDRGRADHGWLDSRHTFSFADYYDPAHMGFRALRVINQDKVAPGGGFPTHPHRDMEIFSYVLEGTLEHKDSMGNGRVLKPGEIQLMSAGRGVAHSEFNPSRSEGLHFLQIWIQPNARGLAPSYTEWKPTDKSSESSNDESKALVISADGREGSAKIHQDVSVYRVRLAAGESIAHEIAPGRGAWLQLIRGAAKLNDSALVAGDGASAEGVGRLDLRAIEPVEALLFDLA